MPDISSSIFIALACIGLIGFTQDVENRDARIRGRVCFLICIGGMLISSMFLGVQQFLN